MSKKIWIALIIISAVIIAVMFNFTLPPRRWQAPLPLPSPPQVSDYNPPPEIKFNSSTDLKKELEKVNPQVLDSDFERLTDSL